MYIPVLLIGSADDGPSGIPYLPTTLNEAQEVFGWWKDEVHTIPASGTSVTLEDTILGTGLYVYQVLNSDLYSNALYNIDYSTDTVSFGNPGTSGTYLFRYVKSPADESNLLLALHAHLSTGGSMPYLWRLAGAKANLNLGEVTFTAKWDGEKYNNVGIIIDGSILTITNPNNAKIPSVSYTISDGATLSEEINFDSGKNKHPVEVSITNSGSLTLPSGTWSLTGGVSGTLTSASASGALDTLDIDGVGMFVLCGGQASGTVDTALTYLEDNSDGASCIVVGSPLEYKDWPVDTYQSYIQSLPYTSSRLIYVVGWGSSYLQNEDAYYWTTLAPSFSGSWSSTSGSPTHKALNLFDAYPIWTKDQLGAISETKATVTRFIQTGLGFFRSTTCAGDSGITTRVKQTIIERLYNALDKYIGESDVDIRLVNSDVEAALEGLPNIRDISYECGVAADSILVTISVLISGEIYYATFNVLTKI